MNKNKTFYIILITFLLLVNNILADLFEFSNQLFDDEQIPEIYIEIDSDSLLWIYENVHSDKYFPASMHYSSNEIDTIVEQVGFRLRGNTSRNSKKKSFKISFSEFQKGGRFFGLKKLNLNGEHNDPSIIRSKLCWDLFSEMKVIAARANHYKVFINSKYYGLYINIEHYDDIFLKSRFGNDNGNLYKCLWPADLNFIGNSGDEYKSTNGNRRIYELKTNEETDDYSGLARLIKIINKTSEEDFCDSLFSAFNIWDFLKIMAVDVITASWDDYWFLKNNYYLYNNSQTNRFQFIPYDYDNSFGINWFSEIDWGRQNIYNWGNANGESRPLVDRILQVSQFREIYSFMIQHIVDKYFNVTYLFPKIDNIKSLITEAAEIDTFRTLDYGFTIGDFHNSYKSALGRHVAYGLKDYIIARSTTAINQVEIKDLKPFFISKPKIKFLDENKISIKVQLFDEMQPDEVGLITRVNSKRDTVLFEFGHIIEDGDLPCYQYSTIINYSNNDISLDYQLYSKDNNDNFGYLPFNAPFTFYNIPIPKKSFDLFINELLADNKNTNSDKNGDNDDWLELFNNGDSAIGLSEFYLTDNPQNPDKWHFPDTVILPKNYLLIWADNDTNQSELHANFKLDKDGEYLGLSQNINNKFVIVDSVYFGTQESDISVGRFPDGVQSWQKMNPTPGKSNINLNKTDDNNQKLTNYKLLHNYPNPFNPSTRIEYNIEKTGYVKLVIYNISGELVKVIIDSEMNSGQYNVDWNGQNKYGTISPAGIYFCKLYTNEFTITRKMIIVK